MKVDKTQSQVTIWYLEMNSPTGHSVVPLPGALTIHEAKIDQYKVNRFLYSLIGTDWHWTDKLAWSDQQWQQYVERENLRTWIAYQEGSIAGYYELERQGSGSVEIMYFGLAPASIGKGFGKALLSHAVSNAWNWDKPERVWVHTCSLDHPNALRNYQQRGFEIFKQESVE